MVSSEELVACTWRYSFPSEHISQDITRGVNLACSTSPMHCSQAHFFGGGGGGGSIVAVAVVTGRRLDVTAYPGVRVEDPDIKNALSNQPIYNPLAKMSERVPPLMSADTPASVSFGCRVSSTDTSWHTIERRLAVTLFHCLYCWKISFG